MARCLELACLLRAPSRPSKTRGGEVRLKIANGPTQKTAHQALPLSRVVARPTPLADPAALLGDVGPSRGTSAIWRQCRLQKAAQAVGLALLQPGPWHMQ